MKNIFLLLCLIGIVATQPCHAQQAKGLYVDTKKFDPYLTKDTSYQNIQYRYDALSRPLLSFTSSPGGVIDIVVMDYDPMGNMLKRTQFSLQQDKKKSYRYILRGGFDEKEFHAAIEKTLNLLDKK